MLIVFGKRGSQPVDLFRSQICVSPQYYKVDDGFLPVDQKGQLFLGLPGSLTVDKTSPHQPRKWTVNLQSHSSSIFRTSSDI